ncbi:MAG TPA: NAD(P)(+) transhydrogenase (Re/Si-specific) subunit beta [Thermoanaerobaculia bacterium]|jgi:NAD(P) transhydrogenase subunit beta|nr:NAD(P)(+) transhydrogenase (Re/Si-specific) subunit beta [Thermoanaerobaculia bacterium]
MNLNPWLLFSYLVASVCFIMALQGLSSPTHARRGNLVGSFGMLVAVLATLVFNDILTFRWIAIGLIIGSAIGAAMSIWIPMTKMPERIALSHSFGGLAAALVGVSEYHHRMAGEGIDRFTMGALGLEVFLGFLTFTGSLMAFGKLQGLITGAPVTYKGQNASNIAMFFSALLLLVLLVLDPSRAVLFYAMGVIGLIVGVLAVIPIGGADMPVVISLLNSYAGLAAAATGFALGNYVLIIAGALDGTSGFLLSLKMSQAMNRSFANVLFGAFGGQPDAGPAAGPAGVAANYNLATVEDAVGVLQAAQSVIVVPGYGMAVSQAQHAVRELAQALEANGATVKYAIHPVAGRMPGHMNVLLAEANVPYDQLYDLDDINDEFARTDVALVVGANDVVNPAAKSNPGSPIYGMPVFNADETRATIVLKRSMNTGFAGIENELFVKPNTMMVLGDAKKTLREFIAGVKEEAA